MKTNNKTVTITQDEFNIYTHEVNSTLEVYEKAIVALQTLVTRLVSRIEVLECTDMLDTIEREPAASRVGIRKPTFNVTLEAPKTTSPSRKSARTSGSWLDTAASACVAGKKANYYNVKIADAAVTRGVPDDPRVYLNTVANRSFKNAYKAEGLTLNVATDMLKERLGW